MTTLTVPRRRLLLVCATVVLGLAAFSTLLPAVPAAAPPG